MRRTHDVELKLNRLRYYVRVGYKLDMDRVDHVSLKLEWAQVSRKLYCVVASLSQGADRFQK